ncbi:MAG: cobalt/nickel transport protein [Thermoleophilaceae bacterium]|jgi:hypothetical protein|nr:cobalt/nickel transport protein [Thermoleophilaceae bacterium]
MSRLPARLFLALALALAVGLALGVAPYASSSPDGLERVARDKGFAELGRSHVQADAPLPGYAFPHIGNERVATGLAGFAGTLGVFALGYGFAWTLSRRAARRTPAERAGASA